MGPPKRVLPFHVSTKVGQDNDQQIIKLNWVMQGGRE